MCWCPISTTQLSVIFLPAHPPPQANSVWNCVTLHTSHQFQPLLSCPVLLKTYFPAYSKSPAALCTMLHDLSTVGRQSPNPKAHPMLCWHLCYGWTDHRLLIEERQLSQIQIQKKPNYTSYLLQTPKPVPKAQANPSSKTTQERSHPGLVGSDLLQKQPSTSPAPQGQVEHSITLPIQVPRRLTQTLPLSYRLGFSLPLHWER